MCSWLPKSIIDRAKKCDCKVCRTLVGSSHFNQEVLDPPTWWELAQDKLKEEQKKTGKFKKT